MIIKLALGFVVAAGVGVIAVAAKYLFAPWLEDDLC